MRKWLVLVAASFGYATSIGLLTSMSVLYSEWLDTFGKSRAETAVAQSVSGGIFNIIGFVFGILVTKFGPRPIGMLSAILAGLGMCLSFFATSITYMTFVFGILTGIGIGGVFLCSGVVVGRFFEGKQKHIALSMMSFGGSVGMMSFTYMNHILSRMYGWRGCMLIVGGIVLNNVPFFAICKQPETTLFLNTRKNGKTIDNEDRQEKTLKQNVLEICRNMNIYVYIISLSCVAGSILSSLIIIVDFFHFSGFFKDESVLLYLIMSITSAVARIIIGFLKQLNHVSVFGINVFFGGVGTLALLLFPVVQSFTACAVLMGCVGTCIAGIVGSVVHMTVMRIVGMEHHPIAFGIIWSFLGICRVVGGPITGYLRDVTGLYDASFYTNGIVSSFGVFLFVVLFYTYNLKARRSVIILARNKQGITDNITDNNDIENKINKQISTDDKGNDNKAFRL